MSAASTLSPIPLALSTLPVERDPGTRGFAAAGCVDGLRMRHVLLHLA
jgi:hypothetical protein